MKAERLRSKMITNLDMARDRVAELCESMSKEASLFQSGYGDATDWPVTVLWLRDCLSQTTSHWYCFQNGREGIILVTYIGRGNCCMHGCEALKVNRPPVVCLVDFVYLPPSPSLPPSLPPSLLSFLTSSVSGGELRGRGGGKTSRAPKPTESLRVISVTPREPLKHKKVLNEREGLHIQRPFNLEWP